VHDVYFEALCRSRKIERLFHTILRPFIAIGAQAFRFLAGV